MGAWTNGTYTRKGLSLLSKLTQGGSLKITRAVTGTGYVTPTTLSYQTAVSGIKQNLSFKAPSYPDDGQCKLPLFLTNKGLTAGYTAKQIGLYAMDPDEGEILYFISQSSDGTDVPSESAMPEYSATWTFYFRYGQANGVTVNVDPSHTVTEDMLNEVRVIAETGVSAPSQGTNIRIDGAADLPFANLRILGKTIQDGTPTVDSPVDLVSAVEGSDTTVRIYGKNLCSPQSFNSMTANGMGNTYDASTHTITMNEGTPANNFTGRYCRPFSYFKVGKKYTISFDIRGTAGRKVSCGWDKDRIILTLTTSFKRYSRTRVIQNESEVVSFYTGATEQGGLASGEFMQFANVQIEEAEGASEFADFTEQVITVRAPKNGVPVPNGGNYIDEEGQRWSCDVIDLAKGVHAKRLHSFTVTSADNGSVLGDTIRFSVDLPYAAPHTGDRLFGYGLCSHLPFNNIYSYDTPHFYVQGNLAWIFLPVTCGRTTTEITAWLSENPITILYELASPVETELNMELSFDSLHTNNPVTTVINADGAGLEADCFLAQHEAGFKRIISYVQRLLSQ